MSQSLTQELTRQSWSTVFKAELRRHVSSRRYIIRVALIAAAGALVGLTTLAMFAYFDSEGAKAAGEAVTTALETASGTVAILLGLSALGLAARETSDGTVVSSLLLVPDRTRLLAARASAPMAIAAVLAIVVAGVVAAGGVAMSGAGQIDWGLVSLSLLVTTVAVPLTALLGFLTGTLVRRGAPAMAIAMGALLVLPLALSVAQFTVPAALSPAVGAALAAMPGVAILQALTVTGTEPGAVPVALIGLGVLAAWVVIVAVGAKAQFRREGHNA